MNEGPHCDLINWKHYTSEWAELENSGSNTFKAMSYTPHQREMFPDVSVDEIVKAVEEQCPGWGTRARTIESPSDCPIGVGIGRYFLRISGTDKSGTSITRTLTFNVPMGC